MDAVLPVLAVLLAIVIVWYGAAIRLNMPWAEEQMAREGIAPLAKLLLDLRRRGPVPQLDLAGRAFEDDAQLGQQHVVELLVVAGAGQPPRLRC